MKRWKVIAAVGVLLCSGVFVMASTARAGQENTGSINGIVIDARGKTVAGAWVTVICGNRPLGGRIPGALSDERGHFAVDSLELGRCRVSACKEEDDVACPPFFNVAHSIRITLTAKVPFRTVKIQLGDKGSVITGMVTDAFSGKPLAASFTLRQLRSPGSLIMTSSLAAFRIFILPSTDYSFEVSVPGYRDWSYSVQQNPSKPLRLAPGAYLHLDVRLEPMTSSGFAQMNPEIAVLYDRLIQPSETNAAAPEILQKAKDDSRARDFLAGKLPPLIVDQLPRDARTVSPVWANAVRLVGQLKITAAVPALKQALTPETQFIHKGYDMDENETGTTFAAEARLDFDIVGRALADIGDPSLPVLSDVLSNGDFAERRRVIWILANIKSPAAQKVLRDHLPSENVSELSSLIKTLLHMPQ